jgi:hypothetical protein
MLPDINIDVACEFGGIRLPLKYDVVFFQLRGI